MVRRTAIPSATTENASRKKPRTQPRMRNPPTKMAMTISGMVKEIIEILRSPEREPKWNQGEARTI